MHPPRDDMKNDAEKRLSALLWQVENEGCAVSHLGETTYECRADAICGLCRLRQERDALREVLMAVVVAWELQQERHEDEAKELLFWQKHIQGLLAAQDAVREEDKE
jgi:hypothetical protein